MVAFYLFRAFTFARVRGRSSLSERLYKKLHNRGFGPVTPTSGWCAFSVESGQAERS